MQAEKEKPFDVGDDSMKTMILPDLLNSEWASRSEMISDFKNGLEFSFKVIKKFIRL